MAIRLVRVFGDPVLRQKAQAVVTFDAELRALVADMRETMKAYEGVGLAANQIGIALRLLVIDVPIEDESRVQFTIVNPVITGRSGSESGEEGCLSIPGIYEDVTRSARLHVSGQDEHGAPFELDAQGFLARAIQHEVDHLDGVLFVDRLSPLKRQFLKKPLEALSRGELPEDYHPPVSR